MKYVFKILSFLFLLILFTSEDCSNEVHQPSVYEQQQTLFGELETNFTVAELDEEELDAMKQRAAQKFNELIDYINIYSDAAINAEFREEARKMISEYFLSELDVQHFFSFLNLQEDTARHFLFNPADESWGAIQNSVVDVLPFENTGTGDYIADISYELSTSFSEYEGHLSVVLKKASKQFGDYNLLVWEQFFKL
ncbi:hypothetical protein [Maribellus mangrovi]|uniref:hypothetical protein n=1 Tax=Maribellus mangrovi TaxID=3133146 RepID=UPI0030EE97EA